ncbi:NAD(P)-dependent oxidoreductase [Actinomadura rayongensis]|uniref:NAD(P)H-binding protein n=1 Tax=Actinomadura rayongensis TaxID=1429076 RepID=A0A6I4WCH3_9ACTN|nr:NAD(P)H-binding protein [Actinomadura rayongensis]MXQ67897.1 NAD(P)H-binding protein [Actinomadura rayongensis]
MGDFVIFGAGGRAGRTAVAEARRRGHRVTAVVRDPSRYAGPSGDGVRVAAGDVTDAAAVAALAAGHDAAINAAAVLEPDTFFADAAHALVRGLPKAGVGRLVAVGLASLLPDADGTRLLDLPGFPAEFRPFCLGHAAGLDVLRDAALDWVYVSPAGDFDHGGPRTGRYGIRAHGDPAARISYADFALVLLDEAETPRHRGVHLAVS